MINDIWYMIYSCAWIYLGWSYQMYTLLSEYRKKRFEENARVNPFVSPMSKNLLQNKHTVNKSLSPHSTFSVPQLKKECLLRFHLLWLHLWRWLNRLGLYALEAIRDRTKAKWRCPNEHPFFSAELPVTWTQNQRNMRHLAPWKTNIRRTHQAIVKLEYQYRGPYKGTETHYVTMPLS